MKSPTGNRMNHVNTTTIDPPNGNLKMLQGLVEQREKEKFDMAVARALHYGYVEVGDGRGR